MPISQFCALKVAITFVLISTAKNVGVENMGAFISIEPPMLPIKNAEVM